MPTVEMLNSLNGTLTVTGSHNIHITDNGNSVITIGGPGNSPFVTDEEMVAVSGHLQEQIDDLTGCWVCIGSASATNLDKNSTVTISGIPAYDILKVVVVGEDVTANPGAYVALNYNDDNNASNYAGTGASSAKGIPIFFVNTTSIDFIGQFEICNLQTSQKNSCGEGMSMYGSSPSDWTYHASWLNTSSRINKMVLSFDNSSAITSASATTLKIKVLGMNF
jgi:hypothetical protein